MPPGRAPHPCLSVIKAGPNPAVAVGPVVAAFAALNDAPDYYEHREALSDLVHLMSEEDALNGGGPGFSAR